MVFKSSSLAAWDHPEQLGCPSPSWPRIDVFPLQAELQGALKVTAESEKLKSQTQSLPAIENFSKETKLFYLKSWEPEIW